ncbi:MAG: MlaD family protein [Fimbriimonadales bacterium]
MQGAWKVGLLVVVFVGLLLGAYRTLGQSLFKPETDKYDILFADASGIAEGTRVLLAGVKIGQVEKVSLDTPQRARVSFSVQKGVKLPAGSGAVLPESLIGIGDNPIQIVPPVKLSGTALTPGAEIVGVRSSPLASLFPDTKGTMEEVNKTLAATRKLIENEELKNNLNKLMATSEKTVAQFGSLASRIDGLVGANQKSIQTAINNAAAAMEEVKKTTAAVQKLASDPQWKDKVAGLLDNLSATTKKADELMASLNEFVGDPALKDSITKTLANTEKMSESGTKIAANAEEMSKNGITITEKATALMDKANTIADEARELLKKLGGVFEKGSSVGAGLKDIEADMDISRDSRPGRWRTDAEVIIPVGERKVHLGLYDAFESNKITLQLSQRWNDRLSYRYGIYASKPGVGVEYRLAPALSLRGDLYDINELRGDIRARYEFGNGLYGFVGVNRLFNQNAPTIGIGFRK